MILLFTQLTVLIFCKKKKKNQTDTSSSDISYQCFYLNWLFVCLIVFFNSVPPVLYEFLDPCALFGFVACPFGLGLSGEIRQITKRCQKARSWSIKIPLQKIKENSLLRLSRAFYSKLIFKVLPKSTSSICKLATRKDKTDKQQGMSRFRMARDDHLLLFSTSKLIDTSFFFFSPPQS